MKINRRERYNLRPIGEKRSTVTFFKFYRDTILRQNCILRYVVDRFYVNNLSNLYLILVNIKCMCIFANFSNECTNIFACIKVH